jgi:type IV pilus assembly protein PilM
MGSMNIRTKTPYFFHDKPLFGLAIGYGYVTVMQLSELPPGAKLGSVQQSIVGYGSIDFDASAVEEGVIKKPEIIATAVSKLFRQGLVGDITTRRVALSIPANRAFIRSLQLPNLSRNEILEAVQLEAEQYIPIPLEELYVDYEITRQTSATIDLMMAAVPATLADSYLDLTAMLGLETMLIEPTLSSSARLFLADQQSDVASFIIDFGAFSSDISIFDKHALVAGSVQAGGEDFTASIKNHLGVSDEEARLIKTKYGLGASKQQAAIKQALLPSLKQIIKELRRMMRYYEERYGTDRPISQIITLGDGATMPGLSDYLTDELRLAVRQGSPWQYIAQKKLQVPPQVDQSIYATVAGLSMAQSNEALLS